MYIKIMYIISCTLVVQIVLVKTVFTLYFLKTYKEFFYKKDNEVDLIYSVKIALNCQ